MGMEGLDVYNQGVEHLLDHRLGVDLLLLEVIKLGLIGLELKDLSYLRLIGFLGDALLDGFVVSDHASDFKLGDVLLELFEHLVAKVVFEVVPELVKYEDTLLLY